MENKFLSSMFATIGLILMSLFTLTLGKLTYDSFFGSTPHTTVCESNYFTSVDEAIVAQENLQMQEDLQSCFLAMSPFTLRSVCSTLLEQRRRCDISTIVNEYNQNSDYYDSLKPDGITDDLPAIETNTSPDTTSPETSLTTTTNNNESDSDSIHGQ